MDLYQCLNVVLLHVKTIRIFVVIWIHRAKPKSSHLEDRHHSNSKHCHCKQHEVALWKKSAFPLCAAHIRSHPVQAAETPFEVGISGRKWTDSLKTFNTLKLSREAKINTKCVFMCRMRGDVWHQQLSQRSVLFLYLEKTVLGRS